MSPLFHGLHGTLDTPKPGHKDDRRRGGTALDMIQELQAVHIGKSDIRNDQVKGSLVEKLQSFFRAFGQMD